MKNFVLLVFSFCFLLLSAAEFTGVAAKVPEKSLQIIQIHQKDVVGDIYFIRLPDNRVIMVDTGDAIVAEDILIPACDRHGIREIDTLFITHFHIDHAGGALSLLNDPLIKVSNLMYSCMPEKEIPGYFTSELFRRIMNIAGRNNIAVRKLAAGDKLDFGCGVTAVVYSVALPGSKDKNLNSHSLVFQLKYGDFTALFTGDLSLQQEPRLFAAGFPLKSDLLKVGHHAGANSTSERFLNAVSPQAAIACMPEWLSRDNRGKRVEKMFKERKIPLYRSWEFPDATVFSDGKTFGIYLPGMK